MQKNNIYKISFAAVLAALIYVATAFLSVPLPGNGYGNFGDCFVLLAALLLGPVYGGLAAGIGSALSDLFLGYGLYAPATFVIKGLMAVLAALLFRALRGKLIKNDIISMSLCAVLAETVMVLGYFIFELAMFGAGVALPDIAGNLLQGCVGAVSGTLIYGVLSRSGLFNKLKSFI